MKKIMFILAFISLLNASEQNKTTYNINEDTIYEGCRDVLANRWSDARWYVTGLMIAKKETTLNLLSIMSMRVVNGVEPSSVCKWYLDASKDTVVSKYLNSTKASIDIFLNIVERSVVQDNGESYEKYIENVNKIEQLFKKTMNK